MRKKQKTVKKTAQKSKNGVSPLLKKFGGLTKSGQWSPTGPGCIATPKGVPCPHPRDSYYIPLCKHCLKTGDPSLKPVDHPKYGKILIATRNLPKGYYAAWWGNLMPMKKMRQKAMEWALQTNKGTIDATPFRKGSQLQFCACPGPNEVPTIDFAPKSVSILAKVKRTCEIFKTLRAIPKNHQLTMMYNLDEKTTDEFFEERGLKRADVGTRKYPAIRKQKAKKA
eukprot:gnl/TRDRNA2_/TRDRNA2_178946_c0_seq1.p1 gnl/TRDRNA2_/TRDRNA2_178946_c0~~gnl/TRDRNA2_/TRDRNA2_178946_c0_seq1.p1  ORF type:complete len:258 (+),score=43.07 gnl/TRDRNA2_/TRDRNA2_178946_c0_seq1:102-776(+)